MQLSQFASEFLPSPLPALLARSAAPDIISFAVGFPGTDLLSHRELAQAAAEVLNAGPASLQYAVPPRRLKEQLLALMRLRGIECKVEQILLCSGAQQGLKLLSQLLIDPGATVMYEQYVFDGIRVAVRERQPQVLTIPSSLETGLDVDAVEDHLRRGVRPAFLYLIPEGQNPLGCSLSQAKRERLLELSSRYQLTLVEDDACGLLTFGEPLPALRASAPQGVFYVGTLSKVVAPALRVGWIVMPEEMVERAAMLKHAADFDTGTYAQLLAAAFLERCDIASYLQRLRSAYAERSAALQEALAEHLTGAARWSVPRAGLYVWLELLADIDTMAMLGSAIEIERVAYSPGSIFSPHGGGNCLRLCFGHLTPVQLRAGVTRLARSLERWTRP